MSDLVSYYDSNSIPALLTSVLYGGYVVLFAICMYIMRCKNETIQTVHQVAIVSLFVLATLGFIFGIIEENSNVKYEVSVSDSDINHFLHLYVTASAVVFGLYTLANAIADFVLIHRCYKIWGSKKRVIAIPVFISVVNNGLALVRIITQAMETRDLITDFSGVDTDIQLDILGEDILISFLVMNLFSNLLIPFMIAGRIWWIGRQISKSIGTWKNSLFRRTVAICLESGMIYPLFLIPTLAINLSSLTGAASFSFWGDLMPMLTQVVGIAPTFIIVRVALGMSIENVEDTVAKNTEGNGGQQTGTLMMVFADNTSTGVSV